MSKSLLYQLFGVGKMPPHIVAELLSEGVLFSEEGVRASLTYKDFRSPGRISNWRREWFPGSLALSRARLVAYRGKHPQIDIPLKEPRILKIEFSLEEPETFVAAFDAGLFKPDWSGRLEYRFKSPIAKPLLEALRTSINEE